jgi:hypothetical protein
LPISSSTPSSPAHSVDLKRSRLSRRWKGPSRCQRTLRWATGRDGEASHWSEGPRCFSKAKMRYNGELPGEREG